MNTPSPHLFFGNFLRFIFLSAFSALGAVYRVEDEKEIPCAAALLAFSSKEVIWKISVDHSDKIRRVRIQVDAESEPVSDLLASEFRSKVASHFVSPPKIAIYPLSGDDPSFLFEAFPSLEMVIAVDLHAFSFPWHSLETLNLLKVRILGPFVPSGVLDDSREMFSSLVGNLFSRFSALKEVYAEAHEQKGHHGYVEFQLENQVRKIFWIQHYMDGSGSSAMLLQNLLKSVLVNQKADLLFIRAAKGILTSSEHAIEKAVLTKNLSPFAYVLEGPVEEKVYPQSYEFFGKTVPKKTSIEEISIDAPFGYTDHLVEEQGLRRSVRLVKFLKETRDWR